MFARRKNASLSIVVKVLATMAGFLVGSSYTLLSGADAKTAPVETVNVQAGVEKQTRQPMIAFDGKGLSVNREAFLSQHDVVYLSPAVDGYEGFPIGNGDLGAMGWTPPKELFFQINKTDTWDDAPPGLFSPWEDAQDPDKAERFTSLRSCGQLRIEPGLPVFDWMYLKDFEGRLSLADAQACWQAEGPLGTVRCRAFVVGKPPVMVVHYEDELSEPVARRVTLTRWGSRVFEHWYRFIRRDFYLGNKGTKAGCEGDETWIEQPTRSLRFAMAAKLVGPRVEAQRLNSREAGYVLNTGKRCSFDLFVSVVTSEEADSPLAKAREYVRAAAAAGVERLYAGHRKHWAQFWSKSFVDLPDDYLENLWYINLYQVGSAARGKYPPHFIGSLWSWNRDVLPWCHYYQWNQQQYTWPLHASGHPELMMPYAKWKREGLEKAIEAARLTHKCDGALYCDVSDRRGNQGARNVGISKNIGATGLTAMDLWRHYEYTLDKDYLEQYAYPVLREVVRFYINKLEKRDDGKYHIPEAFPNESSAAKRSSDTTNDLAGIRKLFPAFVQASKELYQDEKLCARAEEMVKNLAPFVFAEVPKDAKPWGDLKPGDPIIAYGRRLQTGLPGHPWATRPYWKPDAGMDSPCSYHAVNAQLTPVFPANLVGLDDKGSELFEACRNAALSFNPVSTHGHSPMPICFARLGLVEHLPTILDQWVDHFQLFSQGLFCYFRRDYRKLYEQGNYSGPYSASEHKVPELTNSVKVMFSQPEERIGLPRRPFAHMALEAGSVLETTINEMLLQSHKGKIRVFGAVPNDWAGRFTLHAQGGFVVTSERADGEVKYVVVESLKGRPCHLVNPWAARQKVRVKPADSDRILLETANAEDLVFKTEASKVYLVERVARPVSSFRRETIGGTKNVQPKTKGRARLGIPRQF